VPFDAVKEVIDYFDHALILDEEDPLITRALDELVAVRPVKGVPSTEFMAQLLADQIALKVAWANPRAEAFTVAVDLRETAGIEAHAETIWPK
jgi:6-pyruvoyl-tetrahydropterin synthase